MVLSKSDGRKPQADPSITQGIAKGQPSKEYDLKKQAYQRVPQQYRKYISSIEIDDNRAKVLFDFKDTNQSDLDELASTLEQAMNGNVLSVVHDGKSIYSIDAEQDITKDKGLFEAILGYKSVINAFDDYIHEYSVDKRIIDERSTVYIIEDTAIYLIQLTESRDAEQAELSTLLPKTAAEKFYTTEITEVTYNSVFSFNKSRFYEKLGSYRSVKFTGFFYHGDRSIQQMYINEKLPSIDIYGRLAAWDGVPYNFIVFETTDENGVVGRACCHTKSQLVSKEVHKAAVELQSSIAYSYLVDVNKREGMYEHIKRVAEENGTTPNKNWLKSSFGISNAFYFGIDKTFARIMCERIAKMKDASEVVIKKNTTQFFDDRIVWLTFKHGIRSLVDANSINADYEVLREISHGSYHDVEREVYVPIVGRWKNEELMFRCIQKVLRGKSVIYQHSPYFLGRQSYDVFVPEDRIAFEYQGKQHFEPIEFFGGEKSYQAQVERDKKKRELSNKNGITLIYINYWEDVSEELIVKKLEEAGKKGAIPST
ncbi:MAG: hypothetical protein U0L71_03485 [Eggerthellaceae bacterium]|nr:hypothetical protein [Eggerthellaceae bacterium]